MASYSFGILFLIYSLIEKKIVFFLFFLLEFHFGAPNDLSLHQSAGISGVSQHTWHWLVSIIFSLSKLRKLYQR